MKVNPKTYVDALKTTVRARGSMRSMARTPLVRSAAVLLESLEAVDLSDITGGLTFEATVSAPDSRHAWSLHAADQLVLQAIVAGRVARTAFEIGTFNGGTTRVLAEALPDDGQVWTLDLSPAEFDATQAPTAFTGVQVGQAYRSSPAVGKITQLWGDSAAFDFSPYRGRCDLVLVDGGHEYHHGIADTRTAFDLVAPGGIVLWDDFQPYWHGLVRGIVEAAGSRRPRRLAGTSLGVYVDPGAREANGV